jgi:hypothetical protein
MTKSSAAAPVTGAPPPPDTLAGAWYAIPGLVADALAFATGVEVFARNRAPAFAPCGIVTPGRQGDSFGPVLSGAGNGECRLSVVFLGEGVDTQAGLEAVDSLIAWAMAALWTPGTLPAGMDTSVDSVYAPTPYDLRGVLYQSRALALTVRF